MNTVPPTHGPAHQATHWFVLGAGAMGCLWAAHLARAGHDVTLLLRDETTLQRFQGNGSRILLMDGDEQQRIKTKAQLASEVTTPIAHLLVTTKAHQTSTAIDAVRDQLASDATIVLLQNGMGLQQQISAQLVPRNVWVGVSTEGAFCPEYFTVVHAGHGNTRVGAFQSTAKQSIANQASVKKHALLQSLGCDLAVEYEHDIETALWQKLLVNCAINPLTAIYHCRNGELLTAPARRQHLHAVCHELNTLLHALQRDDLCEGLIERAEAVAQSTAKNRSSMLTDIDERRTTEIEFITGYVCNEARRLGLNLPKNDALLEQIRSLSKDNAPDRKS